MGRKSTRENKTQYQLFREAADLTRDAASEKLGFITSDRIEKIESEKSLPHPDEILALAKCYNAPELCYYYCSHECEIGEKRIPDITPKALSQIVIDTLNSINILNKEKDRLIEISVDGEITEDEQEDFFRIRDELKALAATADTLQLWIDKKLK